MFSIRPFLCVWMLEFTTVVISKPLIRILFGSIYLVIPCSLPVTVMMSSLLSVYLLQHVLWSRCVVP